MALVVFAVIIFILAIVLPPLVLRRTSGPEVVDEGQMTASRATSLGIRVVGIVLALFLAASTSYIFVGEEESAHLSKIYFGGDLKEGAIIATKGEKGPQANITPPGFHFSPFLRVIYKIENKRIIEIPENKYGYIVARDGLPLRDGQTYADAFPSGQVAAMISDAKTFLTTVGQKGPQTSVLTPGKYRLNLFLWNVSTGDATEIPEGFVGVIKSNVHSSVNYGNLIAVKPDSCEPTQSTEGDSSDLSVPLVPVGCIGVWVNALNPGKYYINQRAYKVTLIDTRVQTWRYSGGYTKRSISLKVDQQGNITQEPSSVVVNTPSDAADQAVFVKVEGWDVPLELRVLLQVTPEKAPFVVASVGGLDEIEDRILTPAIRSVVRNVIGGIIDIPTPVLNESGEPVLDQNGIQVIRTVTRPTRVLDLIENRGVLEDNVEEIIRREGLKAGVNIKEMRFGEPSIPPELLLARQREQLAQQLAKAYEEERKAQGQRISTEQARATADQQGKLVEAQIEVKRSEQLAIARRNEGLGEKEKLELIATGQRSQVLVLGEERVVDLRKYELLLDKIFTFIDSHPDVLTTALSNAQKFVPDRVFTLGEGGGGLAGAAGILGDFLGSGSSSREGGQ